MLHTVIFCNETAILSQCGYWSSCTWSYTTRALFHCLKLNGKNRTPDTVTKKRRGEGGIWLRNFNKYLWDANGTVQTQTTCQLLFNFITVITSLFNPVKCLCPNAWAYKTVNDTYSEENINTLTSKTENCCIMEAVN
jgi:hypothetical protein